MKKINGLKKGLIYALVTTMIATSAFGISPMSASAATTGKVNASSLNVRSGAGTSYSRVGSVTQGQTVTIVDSVKASDGYTWYKISGAASGYVRGDYISNVVSDNVKSKTGTITADVLNVRTGPGTNYSRLGYTTYGTRLTIISTTGDWYKVTCKIDNTIKTGYVHSDYVKLDSSSDSSGSNSSSSNSGNSGSSSNTGSSTESVIATGVVNVSALNMRSGAGTNYSVVTVLGNKVSVDILSQSGSWYKVRCTVNNAQKTGYVHSDYITKTGTNNSGTSQVTGQGVVNADALNVRSGAGTSNSVLTVIYLNTKVDILSQVGSWYNIQFTKDGAKKTGYVAAEYITKVAVTPTPSEPETETKAPETEPETKEPETQAPTVTPEPENPSYEQKNGVVNVDDLRVRSKASTSSSVYGFVDKGTKVTIIGEEGEWYKVKVVLYGATKEGYLFAEYVTVEGDNDNGNNNGDNNSNNNNSSSTVGDRGTVAGNGVNLRTGAGTNYGSYGQLSIGTPLYIKGKEGEWYKVSCIVNGFLKDGYIYEDYVKINGVENLPYDGEKDNSFEDQIAAFPDSYKNALRRLHEKYPNWTFKAVDIDLDYHTVIVEQNKGNRSHVYVNEFTPFSWLSTSNGDYDWATDTYTNRDGRDWKSASDELIAFYVDPRNFLDEKQIFMFETQSYETSQNREIVASILEGTFMADGKTYTYNGKTYSYVDTFMEAGKLTGVSPYFLASRCRAEVGGGSSSVTGTHESYPGIYNFFNIGAFSSSQGNAVSNGLYYASQTGKYQRPWTSPYLAIVGGAEFIADEYINDGQNTSYFQRFDILKAPYYTHQYMQSIQAPSSEASTRYETYKKLGVLTSDSSITFLIPVYENMPSEIAQMPTAEGNPNSYLKKLSVSGVTLNNTFTYNKTDYSAVTTQSSITISAETVSKYAKVISGTGTFTLQDGMNQFTVVCQAGNGNRTTYTLNIHRQ